MDIKIGNSVRINCAPSKYNGVIGEVFELEEETEYVMVDMPKGTELRLEGIAQNKIIQQMIQSEKTRKTPIARWSKGDPQWFPARWLVVIEVTKSEICLAASESSPS